jgi:hypothetical protein
VSECRKNKYGEIKIIKLIKNIHHSMIKYLRCILLYHKSIQESIPIDQIYINASALVKYMRAIIIQRSAIFLA